MGVLLPLNWPSYLGLTAAKDSGKVLIIIIYCYLIIIISSIIIIKQLFASGSWIFTNIHEPEANNRFSIISQVIIEIPKQRNVKFYHNLPLFIGSRLCVTQCHFQLALWKSIWRSYRVVKSKSKCGLSWSVLLSTTSTPQYSFPKHFFFLLLLLWASLQNCFCKESRTRTSSSFAF